MIGLFGQQETRDDLGIGTVRDALADLFFPGTTTIQTRARYFLFVPWIYLRFEERQVPSAKVAERARNDELRLVDILVQSDDLDGVIGKDARWSLKRLPSSIYWVGLGTWGIRLFPGTQDQYHRSLDRSYLRRRQYWEGFEDPEGRGPAPANWHPHLPDPPKRFPEGATPRLRREEAEYLRSRILERVGGTLLAHLVRECRPWEAVRFAWEHPEQAGFPGRFREQVEHARNFSEVMLGASLLYNFMLAEALGHAEWTDRYREELAGWGELIVKRKNVFVGWERRSFWKIVQRINPRVPLTTQAFVENWIPLVLRVKDLPNLPKHSAARELVAQREWAVKRSRARLQNRRHLELWSGAAGAYQLDFRWGITQRILADILKALHGEEADASAA